MSSAPSSSPPSPNPAFDLDYSIHDFEADPYPDSQYLYRRIEEAMIKEGTAPRGRSLDVACGVGKIAIEIGKRDTRGFGLEPSNEMLGLSRYLYPKADVVLVRAVAESLPFADDTFDRVICQGALDHFVSPDDFMREAARIVTPGGRVIIALANYESLSCKLGRVMTAIAARFLHRELYQHRPYYEIPEDHFHKGTLDFVHGLGGTRLTLDRAYGISLLWLLRAGDRWSWGKTLAAWPKPVASSAIVALDMLAYRMPSMADMIISIWRPAR